MLAATAEAPDRRLRVMVVDDSVVVRGIVARWAAAAGFEVCATASNGRQAIDMLAASRPDIVLLDLEMPELDGVTALPLILERRPAVSVIVVSALTERDAVLSLRCLRLGAVDCLPKPSSRLDGAAASEFRRELVAKLEGLAAERDRVATPARPPPPPGLDRGAPAEIVMIGASTGGPQAIADLLTGLGHIVARVPVLVVQHMPPIFTAVFADHLAAQTGLAVREAVHGQPVLPGQVLVAPGGRHMGLAGGGSRAAIRLDDTPPLRHCRPALDILFADGARLYGPGALGIVLTGMGQDGTEGAGAIVRAGGTVLAQDEATSIVWGMPGSVARSGLARSVLPLGSIPAAIAARLRRANP